MEHTKFKILEKLLLDKFRKIKNKLKELDMQ